MKHGLTKHPLFQVWADMKQRCTNKNMREYKNYGGRGITYCDEWKEFLPFYNWAMESGYKRGLSLDRINVDGKYCPANCRWIPMPEQAGNKRNNVMVTYNGETKNTQIWAIETGHSRSFYSSLARGKTKEEADSIIGTYIERAREEMIQDGTLGDWISVAERLPEDGQRVLVCGKSGAMDVCKFVNNEKRVGFLTHESRHLTVSFWMPLPKIPARHGAQYKEQF